MNSLATHTVSVFLNCSKQLFRQEGNNEPQTNIVLFSIL
jgi:hypothetical protein